MEEKILTRKLDRLGRITIPSEFRKSLNIADFEEVEITADIDKIVIRKINNPDIFGNQDRQYFDYNGLRISKKSVVELSKIAGII